MAASTVTIDANEWIYVDPSGIRHTVTTSQTFSMTVIDGGTTTVEYAIPVAQSVTTTDGYNINIRPNANVQNAHRSIHFMTDAGEGTARQFPLINGEMVMQIDNGSPEQIWKVRSINPSDADYASAGTIEILFEDNFGQTMSIVSGTTVGQAA